MSLGRRSGPEPKPETAETGFAATVSTIMPRPTDSSHPLVGDVIYLAVAEVHEERVRRRVFLSLAPAQRVVENARARGAHAHLYLLETVPGAEVVLPEAEAR